MGRQVGQKWPQKIGYHIWMAPKNKGRKPYKKFYGIYVLDMDSYNIQGRRNWKMPGHTRISDQVSI